MSEPAFSQHEPRSLLVPGAVAAALLALAFLLARHFFPATSVDVQLLHTGLLPTSTVYKTDTIVVGPAQTSRTLFLVADLRVDNHRRSQIFLDDFALTLTDAGGAQLTAKALQKTELPNAELSFPKLKPLAVSPLLRDTPVDPGQSAQGTVVFSLDLPQSTWDARRSAYLEVDIYHGHPINLLIPK